MLATPLRGSGPSVVRGARGSPAASHFANSPRATSIADRSEDRLHVALPLPENGRVRCRVPSSRSVRPHGSGALWRCWQARLLSRCQPRPARSQTPSATPFQRSSIPRRRSWPDDEDGKWRLRVAHGNGRSRTRRSTPATTWSQRNLVGVGLRLGPHHISSGLSCPTAGSIGGRNSLFSLAGMAPNSQEPQSTGDLFLLAERRSLPLSHSASTARSLKQSCLSADRRCPPKLRLGPSYIRLGRSSWVSRLHFLR